MEESYDTTVASYMEACADDNDPVTQEFVEAHLDELLDNHPSIEMQGDMVVDPDDPIVRHISQVLHRRSFPCTRRPLKNDRIVGHRHYGSQLPDQTLERRRQYEVVFVKVDWRMRPLG